MFLSSLKETPEFDFFDWQETITWTLFKGVQSDISLKNLQNVFSIYLAKKHCHFQGQWYKYHKKKTKEETLSDFNKQRKTFACILCLQIIMLSRQKLYQSEENRRVHKF